MDAGLLPVNNGYQSVITNVGGHVKNSRLARSFFKSQLLLIPTISLTFLSVVR
jgi:hypothetical protein